MMSPMALVRRIQDARAAEAQRLAENPEDSSSGKRCKQLYKIGKELGRGAFSVVNEGIHKQSGKAFAIKIVNKFRLTEDDAAALQDEISILQEFKRDKDFDHSHIVRLNDVFEGTDYFYLVTEKIDGGCLYQRIRDKGVYSEEEGRLACRTLFRALEFTHARNVIHRDLKMENLLLTSFKDDCDIKVIDYGFAKKVVAPNLLYTLIGTPAYVAPCILDQTGYGTKADCWSLGVITYCMLCGYLPFRDKDRNKLFRKIRKGAFEFSDDKWGHISEGAKNFIRRLLTTVPADRISSAEALQHPWLALGAPSGQTPAEDTTVVKQLFSSDEEGTGEPSTSTNEEVVEDSESDKETYRSQNNPSPVSTVVPVQQLVVSM